jgi:hypothetical protein
MGAVKEFATLVDETTEGLKQIMKTMADCGFDMTDETMQDLNKAWIRLYNIKREMGSGE